MVRAGAGVLAVGAKVPEPQLTVTVLRVLSEVPAHKLMLAVLAGTEAAALGLEGEDKLTT